MWILIAMLCVMPFETNPYLLLSHNLLGLIPNFTVIKLLGLIGVVWSMIEVGAGRLRLRLLDNAQARSFLIFLGFAILSAAVSGGGGLVVNRLLAIVLLLPLMLSVVRHEDALLRTLRTMPLVMILVFPYAYRQMGRFGGRLGVGLYEANYFALSLLLVAPLAFALAVQEKRWPWRVFWATGVVILLVMIVLTGSRGGFVGLLVALPLAAVRLTRRPVVSLGGLGALMVVLLLVMPNPLLSRLQSSSFVSDEGEGEGGVRISDDSRWNAFLAAVRMTRDYPITGVGLGNYAPLSTRYAADLPKEQIAHNMYVEVSAELGIPALIAFLAILGTSVFSLGRAARFARAAGRAPLATQITALQVGLIGYLVSCGFLSAQYEKFLWLALFLSICAERITRRLLRAARAARREAVAQSAAAASPIPVARTSP